MAHAEYDLVVIGSGPAGQKAALNAAKLGKSIAVIERTDSVGGVCIHTGTVPSKAIREAVLHLTGINERLLYGASYAVKHDIHMSDLLYRSQHVVRTEVDVIRTQMQRNGITLMFGSASFADPNTLRVARGELNTPVRGRNILVAVGTVPARPANVPFTPGKVIDSNDLLSLAELPRSMIIVGGGVIGTEYACMLAACGVHITLVESGPDCSNSSTMNWPKTSSSASATWAFAFAWANPSRRSKSSNPTSGPRWPARKPSPPTP